VCVGLISPALVAHVPRHPKGNSHAYYRQKQRIVGTDAPIVAATLATWGLQVELIGNALGADELGRTAESDLRKFGVNGRIELRPELETPLELIFVDENDVRVWYSEDAPSLWATITEADFSAISKATYVYTDWYALEGAAAAIERALRESCPVLVNLGRSAWKSKEAPEIWRAATFLQASVGKEMSEQESWDVLEFLSSSSDARVVVVTRGSAGCLAKSGATHFRLESPENHRVDTNGAGATFSAGLINGLVRKWPIHQTLLFASAVATRKCAEQGIPRLDANRIKQLMKEMTLEKI